MINLRDMKNELDAMIEERETMCENPDTTMDEQSDMDWRIEEQYRDIADIFLNDEDIMKAAQEILDKKAKAQEEEEYTFANIIDDIGNSHGFYIVEEGTKHGDQVKIKDCNGNYLESEFYIGGQPFKATMKEYYQYSNVQAEEAYLVREKTNTAYIVNVKAVNLNSRDTEGDNINEDYLWNGEDAPVIGQRVFVEKGNFNADAIVINVVETTMEEVENMDLTSDAYVLDNAYLSVVKATYGEDDKFEAYAVWNEPGAMENGEWNDKDLPRTGCICALRLGYKNYVEASILSVEEMSEEEIEELKEKETVYKAYDYDRMVLQRYGFDPDEEGKPEE